MKTPGKILSTFGNLLMLIGIYVLLYVGGLFADEQYNVYAASGDNDVSVSVIAETDANGGITREVANPVASPRVPGSPTPSPTVPPAPTPSRSRFKIPDLSNGSEGKLTNAVPDTTGNFGPSTITRIVVPAIKIDKKVRSRMDCRATGRRPGCCHLGCGQVSCGPSQRIEQSWWRWEHRAGRP